MSDPKHSTGNDVRRSEMALVRSILHGDARALERMMREHNRRLFRVARAILRNDAEAEDALQDGYIQAHRALAGFRGEARLSTWLTRIIVNQALEHRRRRRPAEPPGGIEAARHPDSAVLTETPESLAMRGELRRLIERSIDDLPEGHRSVFMLRAVEGLSVQETAASLGISQASTKTRFLRARAQLREALGQQLGPLLEGAFSFDGRRCDRLVAGVFERLGLPAPTLTDPADTSPRHP